MAGDAMRLYSLASGAALLLAAFSACSVDLTPFPDDDELDFDDGYLVATPPMGWNSWNTFGCNIDDALILDVPSSLRAAVTLLAGRNRIELSNPDGWAPDIDYLEIE